MTLPYPEKCRLLMPLGGDPLTPNSVQSIINSAIYQVTAGGVTISQAQSFDRGAAARLNGSSHMSILNTNLLTDSNNFTIEGRFYFDTIVSANSAGLFMVGTITSNNYRHQLAVNSDGSLTLYSQLASGSGISLITAAGVISANQWFHIALSVLSNTATIYVDGVAVVSGSIHAVSSSLAPDFYLGAIRSASATQRMTGYIQDIAFWSGVAVYTAAFTPAKLFNVLSGTITPNDTNRTIIAVAENALIARKTSATDTYSLLVVNEPHSVLCIDPTLEPQVLRV